MAATKEEYQAYESKFCDTLVVCEPLKVFRRIVSLDVFRKAKGVERLQELQGEGWFECEQGFGKHAWKKEEGRVIAGRRSEAKNEFELDLLQSDQGGDYHSSMDVLHLKHGMERNVGYRFMGRNWRELWVVEGLTLERCSTFGKKDKLEPSYVGTFEIFGYIGPTFLFDELRVLMPRVVKSRDEIFSRWGYCDNHDLSRLDNQSIERDRLIGIGFVLNFVKFISFTFGDKEMISVIEAVSR
ncbi:hypothetical protein Tco_0724994 [Tanacetum coccineum]|uniref:Uncharacterized protein n=1 Tax=Tanacetum coccineum TaxID=301880 RepID=A0ABQ4YD55_9ASTR